MPPNFLRAGCGLLALVTLASAHDNGMDMSMDGGMTLMEGQMLPYLHFTTGDMLWFMGWVPQSSGAMVGACIGLFLLAIVERWIATCRAVMQAHWAKRAAIVRSDRMNARGLPVGSEDDLKRPKPATMAATIRDAAMFHTTPPFILSHDLVRGIAFAGHSALQFAFMLVVMTFQVGFILSIVVGMGVGETLFGRFAGHAAAHASHLQ
ncbi:CTR copper uptake transporter [Phanerochaete sordida]|uniref:Copper transport protein n=1 Tax=Phanerochaete sordida TaxID=48140 RepID=A0A9P3GJA4_9APHY|nr:CTR copper uptake transporter [Phanerochaete sordida]